MGGSSSKPSPGALINAVEKPNNEKEIQRLIESKADVNFVESTPSSYGEMTALLSACSGGKGNTTYAKLLLDAKANPNFDGGIYRSPLLIASISLNQALIQLLLQHNADVNQIQWGSSALIMAASSASYEERKGENALQCLQTLLEAKADPHVKNLHGTSALSCVSNYPEAQQLISTSLTQPAPTAPKKETAEEERKFSPSPGRS